METPWTLQLGWALLLLWALPGTSPGCEPLVDSIVSSVLQPHNVHRTEEMWSEQMSTKFKHSFAQYLLSTYYVPRPCLAFRIQW